MIESAPVTNAQHSVATSAYAYGGPLANAVIRAKPEDFYVDELLGFEPSGEGEHVFLQIEKRCLTTLALRDKIATLAACKAMDVGYAGLKDKWAVTRQWFSVYLPGDKTVDWLSLETPDASSTDAPLAEQNLAPRESAIKLHTVIRHSRKLRRGAHKGNAFKLVVSSLSAVKDPAGELSEQLEEKIQALTTKGMPNYFGEQRFGSNNLAKARSLFAGNKRMPREQRSMCLSAARSFLFNQLLSARVAMDNWLSYVAGDVLMLDGSRSQFVLDKAAINNTEELQKLQQRLTECDIHISGPMCGRGRSDVSADAEQIELQALAAEQSLIEGLDRQGVDIARRPLRVLPKQLQWHLNSEKLHLSFVLPTGSYATVLIRELVECA